MNEPTRELGPVQAQTPSRTLGDDHERRLRQQRTWLLRRRADRRGQCEERRRGERRRGERRIQERRTQDRRLIDRPGLDRRVCDRRQAERRVRDRRQADRRSRAREAEARLPTQMAGALPRLQGRSNGHVDEYA